MNVPPPSPTLLKIHAACAQIAHLSGVIEVLEELYGEEEYSTGLSLSNPDMSINACGAAELLHALNLAADGGV